MSFHLTKVLHTLTLKSQVDLQVTNLRKLTDVFCVCL